MPKNKTQLPVPGRDFTFERSILTIRDQQVVIDADLAEFYEVSTKQLNQAVKRNSGKFPEDFVFRLTEEEKQDVVTNCDHLERLKFSPKTPIAFTEHGVLMAASVLNSNRADAMSIALVRTFVRLRELTFGERYLAALPVEEVPKGLPAPTTKPTTISRRTGELLDKIAPKIELAMNRVLDSVINPQTGATVREEAQSLLVESVNHLRAKLKKAGLENEEIAARVTKMLAEAEKERQLAEKAHQEARKTGAEADRMEFVNTIRKLRLVLEAQKALSFDPEDMTIGRIDQFLLRLEQLADE